MRKAAPLCASLLNIFVRGKSLLKYSRYWLGWILSIFHPTPRCETFKIFLFFFINGCMLRVFIKMSNKN